MTILFSFITGLIFGLGRIVAGMANLRRFWVFWIWQVHDILLWLVMVGAIAVGVVAFAVARQRTTSV